MAWSLFGGKKKAEAKAKLQAKAAMPPIMAPGESGAPPEESQPRRPQGGRNKEPSAEQMDALTVLAAIESAKRELSDREQSMQRQARARAEAGKADPSEDPAEAVARKKQLIQAAMTVHRLKQSTLDSLNPQERAKLRTMAETALGVGQKPKRRN